MATAGSTGSISRKPVRATTASASSAIASRSFTIDGRTAARQIAHTAQAKTP
jgi:hypothetical protein